MKQNSQWLSHVRTRSNTADDTSMPSGSPGSLRTVTGKGSSSPRRRTRRSSSGSSTRRLYSMTSRGERPLSESSSSPERSPDSAAGDDSVTATTFGAVVTRGADMAAKATRSDQGFRLHPCARARRSPPVAWRGARRTRPPRRAPGVLRRGGEGHQGPGLDGPGLRAARLLLPRDRPQPARGRPVRGPGRGLRRRRGRGARRGRRSCCRPTARPPRWSTRPAPTAGWWSTRCARWSPRSTTS